MNIKEQDKMFEKFECPYCGASLLEKGIGFAEIGENIYRVTIDEEGNVKYEFKEFLKEEPPVWYCLNCGEDLPLYPEEGEELFRRIQKEREA